MYRVFSKSLHRMFIHTNNNLIFVLFIHVRWSSGVIRNILYMINIKCLKSLSLAFLVIRGWVDNKKLMPFTYVLERSCEIKTVKVKTIFYFLECKTNSLDSLVMFINCI